MVANTSFCAVSNCSIHFNYINLFSPHHIHWVRYYYFPISWIGKLKPGGHIASGGTGLKSWSWAPEARSWPPFFLWMLLEVKLTLWLLEFVKLLEFSHWGTSCDRNRALHGLAPQVVSRGEGPLSPWPQGLPQWLGLLYLHSEKPLCHWWPPSPPFLDTVGVGMEEVLPEVLLPL